MIILDQLVERLSRRAEISPDEARAFVKALTATLTDAIAADKEADVAHLGVFAATEEGDVAFTPTRELAETVNDAFSLFEPVELETLIDEGSLAPADAPAEDVVAENASDDEPVATADEPAEEAAPAVASAPEPTMPAPEAVVIPTMPQEPETEPETEPEPVVATVSEKERAEVAEPVGSHPRRGALWLWNAVLILLLVAASYLAGLYTPEIKAYFAAAMQRRQTQEVVAVEEPQSQVEIIGVESTEDAPAAAPETAPEPPAAETTAVHLDTVRIKYYITHMAKRYYGNDNFWSYIYKENEQNLGHPEHMQAGTVLVIPPAEKYGIDAADPASVKAAKQLGYEIYRKYAK